MAGISIPIILVRHGQTAWNKDERFRGRADLPLDDTGIAQARATAARLADCGATAVYSSPLQRTMMTAQTIADRLGLEVQELDDLIDIDYGEWQGLSAEEAIRNDPDLYRRWMDSPHLARFPQGEGLEEVRVRAAKVIKTALMEHTGQTIILLSHVVVCRVFVCLVLGIDNSHFWQIGQDTCAINLIGVRDGKLVLTSLNDTCHLRGLPD